MEFDRGKRLGTAHHEAGHAVAALELGLDVRRVGIGPACRDKRHAGECTHTQCDDEFKELLKSGDEAGLQSLVRSDRFRFKAP